MLIIKSENKIEFKAIVEQLKASNIPIVKTKTPEYFALAQEDTTPRFLLFIVVVIGIILGILFIGFINSVWLHQVGNKPQNLSGIIGWIPVIFEITILFAAFIYLIRFIIGISKKEKEDAVEIAPNFYYCFLDEKNAFEKEYILKNFKEIQIIEC